MNPIAAELNQTIQRGNPHLLQMLSELGRNLYFPKGILTQGAEAKEKAHRINATIGIAKEQGATMHFPSVMGMIAGLTAEETLNYAPSYGIPALRKAWKESLYEKNPSLFGHPVSLPVVTCGITHSVSLFADLWLDPGDAVILPNMIWGNYNLILNVRKGVEILPYEMFSGTGFNLSALQDKITETAAGRQKIVVMLNFPHNPSGYTVTEQEGDRIAEMLVRTAEGGKNVIAVLDDAYFGLFFEDQILKESLFARLCGRHPRLLAVKLDGATKENYVWGLRVGFITYGCQVEGDSAPVYEALEKKTAGCIRGTISNASHLSQSLVLKSMGSPSFSKERQEKFALLKRRAERVKAVVQDSKYRDAWDVYPFNSGYFMCLRLRSVDAERLRVHLLDHYGVGLISLGARDLRIAFSCIEEEEIPELFDIILQGVEDLQKIGGRKTE